jgi:hypothetical protein
MHIKFSFLINTDATLVGAKLFGHETVVLELDVGNKIATISMSRDEAMSLMDALKGVGVSAPVTIGSVVLPKGRS